MEMVQRLRIRLFFTTTSSFNDTRNNFRGYLILSTNGSRDGSKSLKISNIIFIFFSAKERADGSETSSTKSTST